MISPARQLARDVLLAVEQRQGYAHDLLHSPFGRGLRAEDQRLATELVLGVLRWRGQLDYVIERAARRPVGRIAALPLLALRLGVYQLRFLARVPAHAAVHDSVEMAKAASPQAAGFVNAVLRHASRVPIAALLAGENDLGRRREVEFSHPAWLLERWSRAYSPAAAAAVAEYDNQPPPAAIWMRQGAPPAELELAPGMLLASCRRVLHGDPARTGAFRERRLFVQDEASQLIPFLLDPQPGDRVLDACAAPGGKAARLAALQPRAAVFALERHAHRARLLHRRLGAAGRVVIADATRPLPFAVAFQRILVDAPCTGTGTLARNPEIRWRLRPDDPARLADLQRALLARAAAALAPRGRLVYSVCSLEPEEGEQVAAHLLAARPELRLVEAEAVLEELRAAGHLLAEAPRLVRGPYVTILPGAVGSDGFFAAILERAD